MSVAELVFCGRCRGQVAAKASIVRGDEGRPHPRSYLRCTCPGGPLLPDVPMNAAHTPGPWAVAPISANAEFRQDLGEALTNRLADMSEGECAPDWYDARNVDLVIDTVLGTLERFEERAPSPAAVEADKQDRHASGDGKRWPFAETPGEFTRRLCNARDHFGGDMLAAVRNVLIENPPTLIGVAR